MFKGKLLMVFLGLLLMGSPFCAKAASLQIGFVDVSKVFDEYPETKKATDALNSEIEKRKAKIDTLQGEIAKLKEDMAGIKDKKKQEKKQATVDQKTKELREYAGEARTFLAQREQELTKTIIDKIHEAIRKVAKEKKVSIVVEKSSVLYGVAKLDLTDEVINILGGE